MAAPALSEAAARAVVSMVEDCLKEGYCPPTSPTAGRAALTEAGKRFSEQTGKAVNTFRSRLDIARVSHGLEPDWSLWRPAQYQAVKQTKRSPSGAHDPIPHDLAEPEGKAVKVLAIGDCHDDPRLPDKTRFEWFGKCAADRKVDRIVQIGDWGSWDSVSRHEDRATIRGRALPHGHVEDYAKLSKTGWQYGVYELTLRNGQIENHKHISMIELRAKYAG